MPIIMHYEPASTCGARIGNRVYNLPRDERALALEFHNLARSDRRGHLIGGVEIPYRCVGVLIFMAQRARFHFTFIAEPPLVDSSPAE